jgi:hypothetical protein
MALTISLLLVVAGFFSAPANADGVPPPPTVMDRCAMDQDEFVIPDAGDGYGYYDPDWNPYLPDTYSTEGAASVPVMVYGTDGYQEQWTLTYTDEPCVVTEVPDRGWAVIGQCYEETGRTEVTMFFENVDDSSDRYHKIEVTATEKSLAYLPITDQIGRVYDGQVGSVKVGRVEAALYGEEYAGLGPGQYIAEFYSDGGDTSIASTSFSVPACGDEEPPPPPPPSSRKARGSLSLGHCGKVRVFANVIGYTRTPRVHYRVVKYKVGRPRTARAINFAVVADTRKSFILKVRPRPRKVVILKVKRPNGVWNVLDRVRTRRC